MENNFNLSEPAEIKPKKRKIKTIIFFFIFIFFIFFSIRAFVSAPDQNSWLNKFPVISQFKFLAESANNQLKGEERDRINILLLGMGGKNHDGGYLTDTIVLASLKPSTKQAALVSIPRDLTVPIEGMGWRKINNVNALAERKNPGSGGLAASQVVSDTFNLPIDYYFLVDFDGFIKIIDEIGGIKVYVENAFDDYTYPARGKEEAFPYEARFEHLHFEKGLQEMDGSLALKYARSRHAPGIEGSDFARARRQQKIIEAIKNKTLSSYILFKPQMVSNIISTIEEHMNTNLKIWEVVKLWNVFKEIKQEDIINRVLDNSPSGLLSDSISSDGAYILTPQSGDFNEIQYLIENIFNQGSAETKMEILEEKAALEILNGTWINGLASKYSVDLENFGFNIVRLGNSSEQNFDKSVIYDLSNGQKIKSLQILRQRTNANISSFLPDWLKADIAASSIQPDFILILGQDADKTFSGAQNKNE
jgi:LCP family protein required for cell wall assembly